MSTLRHNFFFEASKNNCTNFISKKKIRKKELNNYKLFKLLSKIYFNRYICKFYIQNADDRKINMTKIECQHSKIVWS